MKRSGMLTLVAGACAAGVPARAQTAAATVRVGTMSIDPFGEAYYGVDRGFFHDAGIDAQLSTLTNSSTIVQSVLSGDLDTGMANTVQLAVAIARGYTINVDNPEELERVSAYADANGLVAKVNLRVKLALEGLRKVRLNDCASISNPATPLASSTAPLKTAPLGSRPRPSQCAQ